MIKNDQDGKITYKEFINVYIKAEDCLKNKIASSK